MIYRVLAVMVSTSFVVAMSSCGATGTTEEGAREHAGFEALAGPYFGQESPGADPKVFMPGLVSTTEYDRCVTFLDNGKLCVFTRDLKGVRYTVDKNGRWTVPESGPLVFDYYSKYSEYDFTASPDGRAIYFQSNRPTSPEDTKEESNIWVVEWNGSSWGEARPLPAPVNTEDQYEAYPSVTSNGTVYFFSGERDDFPSFDVYRSRFVNGAYLPQEHLEWPINTNYDELDPYVAPDESYLMFGSRRPGGFGRDDTYICFRREDGRWTHPINIGRPLNSVSRDNRINVTPDGKYFFFASGRVTDVPKGEKLSTPIVGTYGDNDVYWSDTSFIDDLKSDVLHKACAADILREEYQRSGLQSAVDLLTEMVQEKKDSFYFPIYELLAICEGMMQSGHRDDSDRFYEALLDTLLDGYRIKLGYGMVCSMNGSVDKGLAMLKEALSDNPSELRWEVLFRGNDLILSSEFEDARRVLQFNVEEFPDWPLAYTRLAGFYEERGDKDKALENCRKALDLDPENPDATAMLERLERPDEQTSGFESLSGPYLGQKPPGSGPKLFLPGLVSTDDLEGCVAFMDEAKVLVFFSSQRGTLYTYEKDGKWISPKKAPFQNTHGSGTTDFTAGPDGRTLFFQSSRPTTPEDTKRDTNTWAVEWTGSGWTDPLLLPPPANTDQYSEGYPSVSRDGSVYFFSGSRPDSSIGDIYRSRFVDGSYLADERLEFPVNSDYHEVDPVVAPDGSYLLFGSGRPGGFGLSDLYVSFRRSDGGWSHPHNVGKEINELIFPIRMSVTPDGKYFFFLSDRPTPISKGESMHSPLADRWGDRDVYWVDTGFIFELERTFRNKQCAAEAIRDQYDENGLEPALEKMRELVSNDSTYFELSELLILCGSMIESGEHVDAERYYEALLSTLPDELRIKQGYAVAHILNASTQKGLELLKEVWTQYPSTKPALSLVMLSYQLFAKSKDEDALTVLEFGAREIGTFGAFFELAEAHARLGNQEQAVQSCKKSLELKPDFAEALDLLEKLERQ